LIKPYIAKATINDDYCDYVVIDALI